MTPPAKNARRTAGAATAAAMAPRGKRTGPPPCWFGLGPAREPSTHRLHRGEKRSPPLTHGRARGELDRRCRARSRGAARSESARRRRVGASFRIGRACGGRFRVVLLDAWGLEPARSPGLFTKASEVGVAGRGRVRLLQRLGAFVRSSVWTLARLFAPTIESQTDGQTAGQRTWCESCLTDEVSARGAARS